MSAADKPKVLFVLGGPGAGKGTQCTKFVENYKSWAHVSAGDCLRAERNDPSSKDGELINSIIKEGKLVPSAITVKLLVKAMAKAKEDGKTHFLVDGFPRSVENLDTWKAEAGNATIVCGILYYEAKEDELEKRLLTRGRTSCRVDDNIESIGKRFRTYMGETMPIIEKFKAEGKVFSIDGMPPEEEVWKVTKAKIEEVEESGGKQANGKNGKASSCHLPPLIICGPSGVGKGTLIERLQEAFPGRFGFSVSHTTRAPRRSLAEVDGVSYHFTDLEIMKQEVQEKGKFVEYAHVHGNIYGTSKAAVEAVMQQGKICLLDIDVQGVQKVKESGAFPDAKFIFVKAPSMEELEKRLRGRGTEKEEAVQKRLKGAQAEIDFCDKNPSYWNCVLVNNDLENSTRELLSVIRRLYPALAQSTKAPPAPRKGGLLRLLMCGCGN